MRGIWRLSFGVWICQLAITTEAQNISVGSKKFTESYVLGEIAKGALEAKGFKVEHRQGIGATSIVWTALKSGEIALYPEYTGTISEELLKSPKFLSDAELRERLKPWGIGMSEQLGFNNTYALVMRRKHADELRISRISDLRGHPGLSIKFSHEFLNRKDGWPNLSAKYGLTMDSVEGIDHGLAYEALRDGQIDVTDAYSTDAKIGPYDLKVLDDDLQFFPSYKAVFLYRLELAEQVVASLNALAGTIDEDLMIRLNAEAEKTSDFTSAAALYFKEAEQAPSSASKAGGKDALAAKILRCTGQHLRMVGWSLLFAIIVGIPLGIRASRKGFVSQLILGGTGVVQTIPSLALLALLVPVMGIEARTAILALFLYSLLPIVRNTAAGLQDIPISIRESAAAIGLEPMARLFKVFLPMASRSILAGIKTSAIINIGTATLAALIAQGGYGEPIISGLAVNNADLILQGAIPAAVLALVVGWGFDLLDRVLIPKGLRLEASHQ